jgi:hypothetical protein
MDTNVNVRSDAVNVVFTLFEEIEDKIFSTSELPIIYGIYGIEFINDTCTVPFVCILLNIDNKNENIETSVKQLLNEHQQNVVKFEYVKPQPFQLK